MARQPLLLVTFFFLLGAASVYPRLTRQNAQAEKIHSDPSHENVNFDQTKTRSSRVIRGLPPDDSPYPSQSNKVMTTEQLAAARKQVDKSQQEKEKPAHAKYREKSAQLGGVYEAQQRRQDRG